jgi:hypothetical protein
MPHKLDVESTKQKLVEPIKFTLPARARMVAAIKSLDAKKWDAKRNSSKRE